MLPASLDDGLKARLWVHFVLLAAVSSLPTRIREQAHPTRKTGWVTRN